MDNSYEKQSLKYTIQSSLILALVNTGDVFLYAYLPTHYQTMGISLIWVGVILSINRFARLFLNGWVAYYLSTKGIRIIVLVATSIAFFTTVSYGFIYSLFLWITVRVLWGISFSTLRLSSTIYALQYKKRGIALGLSRGIIELGAVFALVIGPVLVSQYDRCITFLIFGLLNFVALVMALKLPTINVEIVSKKDLILSFPNSFNRLVLLNAIIIEGILVVLISRLVQMEYSLSIDKSLFIVGMLLGYRRLCFVLFSPLAGRFSDKWGFDSIFISTSLLITLGIALISFQIEIIGIIIVFTFGAMNASISSGTAVKNKSYLKDINDNATWRDIGTALGALVGALLLEISNLNIIFIFATAVLILFSLNHLIKLTIYKPN